MALDLKEIERKIDEALAKETPQSLSIWLDGIRESNTRSVFIKTDYKMVENEILNPNYLSAQINSTLAIGLIYKEPIKLDLKIESMASMTFAEITKQHIEEEIVKDNKDFSNGKSNFALAA